MSQVNEPNEGGVAGTPPDAESTTSGEGGVEPERYEIVVDGESKRLTMEELKTAASKAEGADRKFREASDLRKQAQQGLRVAELIQKAKTGQIATDDLREFGSLVSLDEAQIEEMISMVPGRIQENETMARKSGDKQGADTQQDVTMDRLSPDVREKIEQADSERLSGVRERIYVQIKESLDKDQDFRRMLIGRPKGSAVALAKHAEELARGEVRRRVVESGEPYGPDVVQAAIKTVRETLRPILADADAGKSEGGTAQPRTGGLGPAPGLQPSLQSGGPPKRVPVTDPGYGQYLMQKALYEQQGETQLPED